MEQNQSNKRRRLDDEPSPTRIMTDLPDVLIKSCLEFVGPGHYRFVAGTCRKFQKYYSFEKQTTSQSMAASVSCAEVVLEDSSLQKEPRKKQDVLNMLQRGAARAGNVQVLQWALDEHESKASHEQLALAAAGGHLNVLEWANNSGMAIQWLSYQLCSEAAFHGQVHMLDYIYERACHDGQLFDCASTDAYAGGHICVLEWMKDKNLLLTSSDEAQHAVRRGKFVVLEWLKKNDLLYTGDGFIWNAAARNGAIKMLQWLSDNGFADTIDFLNKANIQNTDVLEWANEHGIEWTVEACKNAATYGNLETLKWLREHGCPWDSDTIKYAQIYDYESILWWARDNECPEPQEPMIIGARRV